MEIQNLNRLNDVLFKAIFGENPEITLDFINSIFKYENTPTFQSIDYIDRELDPLEEEGKESRLDLLARESKTGEKVNLEVQVVKQKYYGKRSLYYWSRLYNDLKRGDEYSDLKRTITINLLDFILFEDEAEKLNWHSCFGLYDKKTGKRLTEDLEMHFIELPKWKIQKNIKDMNTFESWISYFDKKTSKEELEEIIMHEPMVREAIKRESIFTQDEIRRRKYDLMEKAERDLRGQMKYATEQGIEQGIERGNEQTTCRFKALVARLCNDGKTAEIPAIIANDALREQMMRQYNIC